MNTDLYGPRTKFSRLIHAMKHRPPGETFDDCAVRCARTTADDEGHFRRLLRHGRDQLIIFAGRQQRSLGLPYQITAFNCFVGPDIPDDTAGIFDTVKLGALTMRSGGGVGWDFSSLRPSGEPIRGLGPGAFSSGPVSFMGVWNAMCETIMSAGSRRGAMMGVLRVDHPDILKFVSAKSDDVSLKNFNISVAVTDAFMEALEADGLYGLQFNDTLFGYARAVDVWARIMENNWDYAEPGVLFIDRINQLNPLWYCEEIKATNPCGEQPLPSNGACLLASINVTKLLKPDRLIGIAPTLDFELLNDAVDALVRACDNVIDRTTYPLPKQKEEALLKRRMGIGVTGMANALELMGYRYGCQKYLETQDDILRRILHQAYQTSIAMAKVKGSFPLFDREKHLQGEFIKTLPEPIRYGIEVNGLRNGLLTSIAPTGTLSLTADNISSGIEPVHQIKGVREVITPHGLASMEIEDFAKHFFDYDCTTADQVPPKDHIDVLCHAQKYVCSSISKTCNVNGQIAGQGPGITFNEFKDLYLYAYRGGAKSCTTFNLNGKRAGIIRGEEQEGAACYVDPATGAKSCDE